MLRSEMLRNTRAEHLELFKVLFREVGDVGRLFFPLAGNLYGTADLVPAGEGGTENLQNR